MENEQKQQLFREKSLKKMSTVDKLDDVIKVENPRAWMLLGAILLLLLGVCVWGIFGHLDTRLQVAAVGTEEGILCYVPESQVSLLTKDTEVEIEGETYAIAAIETPPVSVGEALSDYQKHIGQVSEEEWVYPVALEGRLAPGTYTAVIVTERVSPASFIFN